MRSRQAIPALVISATPVLRPFSRPRASARTLNGAIVSAHSGDQSISSIRSPRAVMKTSVPAAPITQFVFRLFLLTISAAALRTGICTGTTTKAVSSLHRRVHRPVSPVRVSGENTKRRSALLNDLPVSDRDSLVTPTRRSKVAAANHVHNAQYSQAAYNLTVFWSRVGRLVHHSGGNAGAAKLIDEVGHPACPSWMRDREAALLQPRIQTIAHLSDFDAHQLAKTTHGIARIGLGCAAPWGPLWCKLEIEALSKMAGFNAQDIANVAWAFTSVGFDVPKLFDALAAHAAPMLPEFRAQHLSVVAWAFASNRHSAPRLMDAIASESHSRLHEFNGQALSNTLWAFAKMNHAAPDLFRAVEKQICTRLHELKDQELVSLALSFATMSHTPRRLFEALSAESARRLHRLDGRSLSNLAWAFAVADHAADDLFGSGSCFARRCAERKFASESGLRQLYQWELWRQVRARATTFSLLCRHPREFLYDRPLSRCTAHSDLACLFAVHAWTFS
mmetsp:Transcript_32563/g.71436  ORF Transcript_32563/g.71436 Transcript_32563/m.71436 type:complete len:507 (-) Transcript_32563:1094-2614(-)